MAAKGNLDFMDDSSIVGFLAGQDRSEGLHRADRGDLDRATIRRDAPEGHPIWARPVGTRITEPGSGRTRAGAPVVTWAWRYRCYEFATIDIFWLEEPERARRGP